MNSAASGYSIERQPNSSVRMDDLLSEYWKLAEFEAGIHQLYNAIVDGSHKFSFVQQSLTDLLDRTAQRQSEIVEAITPLKPNTAEELKAKARVILRCLSVEDGDLDGMLVRAVIQDLIGMPLRATDIKPIAAAIAPKKRGRKPGLEGQPSAGFAGEPIAVSTMLQSGSQLGVS